MDSSVAGLITDAANKYGEDPQTALKIANIESGGRNVDNSGGSGAAGIYQFMPSTWAHYGNGADPHDVAANIDAGVRLMRDNRLGLQKAGFEGNPGQVYLAHQQGLGGATKLLSNPDAPAASLVGAKAVTANGGSPDMTAAQFAGKWMGAVDGHAPTVSEGGFTPRTVAYSDLMAPPSDSFGKTAPSPQSDDHYESFGETMKDAANYYSVNSLSGRMWSNLTDSVTGQSFAPDPNFAPTSDDIKKYATAPDGTMLPPEYLSRFASATSDEQAKWIAQRAWDEEAKTKKVESLGWGDRYGIKLATMLLDPASLAIGAATDGAMSPATQALAKYGILGRIGAGAATGGVANVAITAAMQAQGQTTTDRDYLNALALGMTLGGAFGPLAHGSPKVADEAFNAGKALRDHVDAPEARRAPEPRTPSTDPWMTAPAEPGGGTFVPLQEAEARGLDKYGPPDEKGVRRRADAAVFYSGDVFTGADHAAALDAAIARHGEAAQAAIDADPEAHFGFMDRSVGAAFDPHANIPLDLKTGDWTDIRNKGQFTSNFTVDSANVSNFTQFASGVQTASSPFVEHRLAGANLAGNPIGFSNAANPVDAALRMTLARDSYHGLMNRFLKPAFHEWADNAGYSRVSRMNKRPEFMEQVHDYLTGSDPSREYDPAVKRFADQGVRPVYANIAKELNDSGVTDNLPHDPNYLPRMFDPNKVEKAYREFGTDNMASMIKAGMKDMPWAQGLDEGRLDTLSRGYVTGIAKRALNLDEDWSRAWSGDDFSHLHTILMEDAGMSREEAQAVVDTMARQTEDPSRGSARLKHRLDLDPATSINIPGKGSLALRDLVHTDVGHITERYIDQMSGRIALAKTRIVDPDTGKIIVNGIRSEGDFKKMLSEMNRNIEERYMATASDKEMANLKQWRDLGNANLQFMYDRLMGKTNTFGKTKGGQFLRVLRKYTFDRQMGATGWSHMSIFASNVGNGGFLTAMQHVPAFRHIVSQDGEWMRAHGLDQELEAFMGNHTDPLRGLQLHDWGDGDTNGKGILGRVEHVLNQTNKITAIASGLSHIIDFNRRWGSKIIAQKFANMAAKARELPDGSLSTDGISMKRMMQLGLDQNDLQKVLREVKDNGTTERGILFNHKLTKLNLDKWDQETAYKFQGAISRYVNRVVQENDIGSMHRWVSSPIWQMMMQFRNFPMVGTTKQLTYNLVMHDPEALQYALTAAAFGGLTYVARTQINSIGRSDRQEYLQKALAPQEIARAIGHHSGLFGLAPAFIDTGMRLAGADPLFDFRTTGNTSSLWGAPGVATVNDEHEAAAALYHPWAEGRTRSQAEWRALIRMVPWSNTLPATLLTNAAVSGLPLHAPARTHTRH